MNTLRREAKSSILPSRDGVGMAHLRFLPLLWFRSLLRSRRLTSTWSSACFRSFLGRAAIALNWLQFKQAGGESRQTGHSMSSMTSAKQRQVSQVASGSYLRLPRLFRFRFLARSHIVACLTSFLHNSPKAFQPEQMQRKFS